MNEETFGGERPFGLSSHHAILLVDGSGSMKDKEQNTKVQKSQAVAQMIQALIDRLYEFPALLNVMLTIIFYDSRNWQDVRLDNYDVASETYYKNTDFSISVNHDLSISGRQMA